MRGEFVCLFEGGKFDLFSFFILKFEILSLTNDVYFLSFFDMEVVSRVLIYVLFSLGVLGGKCFVCRQQNNAFLGNL